MARISGKEGFILLTLAVLGSGCVTTRPLVSLAEVRQLPMIVEMSPRTNSHVVFTTARGRNAEQAGATGGLIGMLLGASVGAEEESRGREMVKRLHRDSGQMVGQLVMAAMTNRLVRSGIQLASIDAKQTRLVLDVKSVGLREVQRGFWVTQLEVEAKLRKPDGDSLWNALATSTGTKLRRAEEFASDVGVYRQDLSETVEDVARQLVVGPIRQ